jgi:phosphoenolpyruvate carboxylase
MAQGHRRRASNRANREAPIPLKSGSAPRKSAVGTSKLRLDEGLSAFPRAFASERASNPAHLQSELRAAITDLAKLRDRNPFGNSVKLLALELNKRLDGNTLDFGAIEDLIQHLSGEAFAHRATRMSHYLGEVDSKRNEERLQALFLGCAGVHGKRGKPQASFTEFRALLERELFGIVITAHPTFSQTRPMMQALAELATGRDPDGKPLPARERARLLAQARAVEHRPPEVLDLTYEHELSLLAIENIHRALQRAYEIALEVAAELYPQEWETLTPKLITIASWVGYDLDGRSDIRWSDTLLKRLKVQVLQLERYLATVEELRQLFKTSGGNVDLVHLMDLLESRLALAINEARDEMEVFFGGDGDSWTEDVRRIAKRMHKGREMRLIDSAQLLELVERAIAMTELPAARRDRQPWSRPRPYPCPPELSADPQRNPQPDRHGGRTGRPGAQAFLYGLGGQACGGSEAGEDQFRLDPGGAHVGQASLHAGSTDAEIHRRDHPGALPDRRMRNTVDPDGGALFRTPVRRRSQG